MMKEVTVEEMKSMIDNNEVFQLVDVRENYEYDIANLGGELIPLATVPFNIDKISRENKTIIHCKSGARSAAAIQLLEKNFGFTNLYNLKGGILAWADRIDSSVVKY